MVFLYFVCSRLYFYSTGMYLILLLLPKKRNKGKPQKTTSLSLSKLQLRQLKFHEVKNVSWLWLLARVYRLAAATTNEMAHDSRRRRRSVFVVLATVVLLILVTPNILLATIWNSSLTSREVPLPQIKDVRQPGFHGMTKKSARDCYQQLGTKKNEWIDRWLADDVPLLDAVLELPGNVYQITIITKHLNTREKAHWNLDITWYCNSVDNPARILVSSGPVHMVECSLSTNETSLINLWPSKASQKTGKIVRYEAQVLEAFLDCDRLDLTETPSQLLPTSGTTQNNPKLGACIIERHVNPSHLAQWIEYHRLLGFDHFWVYQNEPPSSSIRLDHKRPYVTYLPYNFVWKDHESSSKSYRLPPREIFWQEAMQLRCLYHAKRLGMKWVTTTDVDEYIWINSTDYHRRDCPLKHYLLDHAVEFDQHAGLTMNSVFFGRSNNDKSNASEVDQRPLMDYLWRPVHSKWQRYKQIYHVPKALAAEVHSVKGEGGGYQLRDVYLHHYKTPWQGIFKAKQKPQVKDTMLYDLHRDRVMARIATGRENS